LRLVVRNQELMWHAVMITIFESSQSNAYNLCNFTFCFLGHASIGRGNGLLEEASLGGGVILDRNACDDIRYVRQGI